MWFLLITVALTAACSAPPDRTVCVEGGLANAETRPATGSDMPPVTAFASLPVISHLQLSPSGKYLAFLQNTGGETLLITRASPRGEDGDQQATSACSAEIGQRQIPLRRFRMARRRTIVGYAVRTTATGG